MKKLLLGCGVLLALGLASMGYVVWQLWPDIQQTAADAEEFERRLMDLEEAYPFEPDEQTELDGSRFATSLDMRVVIGRNVSDWKDSLDAFGDTIEERDLGFIEEIRGLITRFTKMFEIIAPLEDFSMSPSEFNYHTRVLWAALDTIDKGLGDDPAFDSLRSHYQTMKKQYNKNRAEGSLEIEELIGQFDASVLSKARNILKTDPARVDQAVTHASAEAIFMTLPKGPQNFDPDGDEL